MGFAARIQWLVLAAWQLGQAWQWDARRQMVEVQELCRQQQEQDSVCDLWVEKIVCRGSQASRGPVLRRKERTASKETPFVNTWRKWHPSSQR